jgi:hypothetical protein
MPGIPYIEGVYNHASADKAAPKVAARYAAAGYSAAETADHVQRVTSKAAPHIAKYYADAVRRHMEG